MNHRSTCEPAGRPGRALGRRRLLALLGLAVASGLAACGKKGPLRLPEAASPDAESSDEETR
ncbi:MAG: LPS translocon maturation chaperone LptM [Geminicoccaceae bacterium]